MHEQLFFFFLRIQSIFNTHTEIGKSLLKKLTVVYIQKGLHEQLENTEFNKFLKATTLQNPLQNPQRKIANHSWYLIMNTHVINRTSYPILGVSRPDPHPPDRPNHPILAWTNTPIGWWWVSAPKTQCWRVEWRVFFSKTWAT